MSSSGQHASIEALYAEYRRPLLAHLQRLVSDREAAEDLLQESFVKALRRWDQHDPQAGSVAWLYRIATNTAYDYLRRRRRIRFLPLFDTEWLIEEGRSMETRLGEDAPVQAALAQLPPGYRIPLMLHSCVGCSTQEIADVLGCSNSAVKSRLFRARERFRRVYQG
jgi:RNA polymerase sigma-70 factor, ECF subfamily